jgi:hypothetical protein
MATSRARFRHPLPAQFGDNDADDVVPRPDRERDRLAGSTRAAVPDTIDESSLPAAWPRPRTDGQGLEHPGNTNARAARARSARPPGRPASRSPGPPSQPSPHPPFPGRPRPVNQPGSGARSAPPRTSSRYNGPPRTLVRGPSVVAAPVRGRPCKADGPPHRSQAPIPVRYASVAPATPGSTARQDDTQGDRAETPRPRETSQLTGRFRSVWQVLGSNQRRLSRRFYRPLSLARAKVPLTSGYALTDVFAEFAVLLWPRSRELVRATDRSTRGHGRPGQERLYCPAARLTARRARGRVLNLTGRPIAGTSSSRGEPLPGTTAPGGRPPLRPGGWSGRHRHRRTGRRAVSPASPRLGSRRRR